MIASTKPNNNSFIQQLDRADAVIMAKPDLFEVFRAELMKKIITHGLGI